MKARTLSCACSWLEAVPSTVNVGFEMFAVAFDLAWRLCKSHFCRT